jgi:hypothetical protein
MKNMNRRSFAWAGVLWFIFVAAQVHHAAAHRSVVASGADRAAP